MSKRTVGLIFLIFFGFSRVAFAACGVAATTINFGSFNPFVAGAINVNGTITITCDFLSPVISYTLTLNPGGDGSYNPRHMLSGAHTLNYNLYTTAAFTNIWGDGTAGTSVVSAVGVGCVLLPCTQTIFGSLPRPQATAFVGAYNSTITVTLSY